MCYAVFMWEIIISDADGKQLDRPAELSDDAEIRQRQTRLLFNHHKTAHRAELRTMGGVVEYVWPEPTAGS